ncbi:MAG: hypothetical protein R3C19_15080 [Planctomycetaceae bacterium]
MLLNTWLSAAKRQLFSVPGSHASMGRRSVGFRRQTAATELLESRALLTALVINNSNVDDFTNAAGTVALTNATLGANDSIVIEDAILTSTGKALTINLSNINLDSIAIESTDVTAFTGTAIDINLTNVTGLHTIAIEDVLVNGQVNGGNGLGISINLSGTDVDAITVDDSEFPGVRITATNNSDILNGLITQNTIVAPAGFEGVLVSATTGATANGFRVLENQQIDALDRDAVKIKVNDSPLDGLVIADNVVGTDRGADVLFRAEGDTFQQPFRLQNNATDGERITSFVFDLTPLGLIFDTNAVTGKAFTVTNDPGNTNPTGVVSSTLDATKQILTVTFDPTAFAPGEALEFVIDVDLAPTNPADPPIPTSVFGNDLVGAAIEVNFTAGQTAGSVPKRVSGVMVADPDSFTASQFAVGAGVAGNTQGINLDLTNAPVTNASILRNTVTGSAGHGLLINARAHSDVTGVIEGNTFVASGQDGIHMALVDSDFTGAVIGNVIANNSGFGVNIQPEVSRKGLVEDAFDNNPVVITSTNHGLQTGDEIIIQGMTNDVPGVPHPGNGRHVVTRIDNNRFSLQGVNGLSPNVVYAGGGAWYLPDFQGGVARNLITIDMQASVSRGTISAISTAGGVTITSADHGLTTGDQVRVSNAAGVLGVNGVFTVTVTGPDTFTLDGAAGSGTYDTSEGLATWEADVVTAASNTDGIVITSLNHGLESGEQVRVMGVEGNTAANGTFTIVRIDADHFRLNGAVGNGAYTGQGTWVRLADLTPTGDRLPQEVSGNSITGNGKAGFYVDLTAGTIFNGDIVGNDISTNRDKGIHIESHSFGLGTDLPLNPADPLALPSLQDISFDVNIGTAATGDGNTMDRNVGASILIDALDFATGSFEIRKNRITSTQNDNNPGSGLEGDGIVVRLQGDLLSSESVAILAESVIDDNIIGVDNQGNEGNGLSFILRESSKIQDLRVTDNNFLNNALDGFHFVRSEDGDLNSVVFERNNATNNGGDGFELFAINTVKDRLDFQINENNIDDNGEYGLRIDVQADARIGVDFNNNSVRRNGAAANGNGHHPNDGVAGSAGSAGGVGILAFQQVEVVFNATQSHFDENFGDGFSVDAFNFFDTLIFQSSFTDSTFNSNMLTGFRNHGASFGTIDWLRSEFSLNGEDGARSVSIEDKTDFFERRVGGNDIDIHSLSSQFVQNGQSGLQVGQGVSAVLGDGTIPGANLFDNNGEDGLKITQDIGAYLAELGRIRVIQADLNFYRNNQGDGIDIGHFAQTEGGNVEHGDEVASDVNVMINNSTITGNHGDGVEYLGDSWQRLPPIFGGGQDIDTIDVSSLTISDSRINNNVLRGVDILNRVGEDSRISLINNEILSNGLEGIYVLNTASHFQLQNGPEDPLDVKFEQYAIRGNDSTRVFQVDPAPTREIEFAISPNIELRVQDNRIESNGTRSRNSVVPVNNSAIGQDASGNQSLDWTHNYASVTGTLGGLVVRVGAVDTIGRTRVASPEAELGLSGIDAEVVNNSFDGNIGADFYVDSFVSQIPRQSRGSLIPDTIRSSSGMMAIVILWHDSTWSSAAMSATHLM